MRTFLEKISPALADVMGGKDPENDEASEHEIYLLNELRLDKAQLNIPKIMRLLNNDENFLQVRSALAYMKNYDMELRDIKRELEGEEKTDFDEVWDDILVRWESYAKYPPSRPPYEPYEPASPWYVYP